MNPSILVKTNNNSNSNNNNTSSNNNNSKVFKFHIEAIIGLDLCLVSPSCEIFNFVNKNKKKKKQNLKLP